MNAQTDEHSDILIDQGCKLKVLASTLTSFGGDLTVGEGDGIAEAGRIDDGTTVVAPTRGSVGSLTKDTDDAHEDNQKEGRHTVEKF